MKILQINKYMFIFRGAERYISEIIRLLISKGHDIIPFTMQHERNYEIKGVEGFEEFYVKTIDYKKILKSGALLTRLKTGFDMIYSFEAKRRIDRLTNYVRPDIAHLHNIYYQLTPSILPVLKRKGIPRLMTVHDCKLMCPNHFLFREGGVCERCRKHRYYRAVIEKCVRKSYLLSLLTAVEMYVHNMMHMYENNIDLFIAPSRFLKSKLTEWGMDGERIVHLPYCINLDGYRPNSESCMPYITYSGSLSREKGVDVLINAMRWVDSLELLILGTGEEETKLKRRVAGEGLTNVRFLGFQKGDALKNIVRNAMFTVMPSICYDNSPLAIYESMAMGKPVVAARIGGIPELVVDNETGLLFEAGNPRDLAEKIRSMMKKPDRSMEMGRRARLRLENEYSPGEHCRRLLEIYQSLQ